MMMMIAMRKGKPKTAYKVRGMLPRKIDLSSPVTILLIIPGGNSAMVYYFSHCVSSHVCPGESFILESLWPFFGERNRLFDFLLVEF